MIKYKSLIWTVLILFFLIFSFLPTIFLISQKDNLADKNREFILEHNYYWPDYNLYLSKIRQGFEGRIMAHELYTSEPHGSSLIQEFYVILGLAGRFLGLIPNYSYLLGRIILAPLLLLVILKLVKHYFPIKAGWQILAFLIVVVSGSFPRIWFDQAGSIQIARYMEWWSNIDALQRITFIPHILFGQVVSFYLLYQITNNRQQITRKKLFLYLILGNLAGIVFPPSLITLISVIILIVLIELKIHGSKIIKNKFVICYLLFVILSLPPLFYLLYMTKIIPWSTLVDLHRTHPMMIPLDQYFLGTGPIMVLGFIGAVISIIKRDKKFQPLILWITVTLGMASFFSVVREQSPLRFTQTGLFIPLGILGAYFFQEINTFIFKMGDANKEKAAAGRPCFLSMPTASSPDFIGTSLGSAQKSHGRPQRLQYNSRIKIIFISLVTFYLFSNLLMMKVSLDWQITWIKQLVNASIPAVPSPPQAMFPLKEWMDAIRWLRDNTNHNDVVLAEVTAGNYIPAYSGNFVYFGQANTVDYDRKQLEADSFFRGLMLERQAEIFLTSGRIKYVFYSIQEKGKSGGKSPDVLYPILKPVYTNSQVTIYSI